MRRVVVTGLGAVTPLGASLRSTWSRLLASHSGIVSTSHMSPSTEWSKLPSRVAGLVPLYNDAIESNQKLLGDCGSDGSVFQVDKWQASDWLEKGDERRMAKFTQYAIGATEMALRDAGIRVSEMRREELEMMGVCLGSGIGNFEEIYDTSLAYSNGGYKKVSPLFVPKLLINLAAGHISMKYGLEGPNHSVTTACTTGAHAIGDAARFISFGDADLMIAGGSESCIHPLALAGFARSRSLSTEYNDDATGASRPFDAGRDGFVIAEGAGVVVLEELSHAEARGAEIYAEIIGYGCSGDAFHMTAPREDGAGALLAMKKALKNAGTKPSEISYINAHATSTPIGDAAENAAIGTLMLGAEGVQSKTDVTVSSTKGAIGHLLGAAGSVEAIFAIKAVKENVVPPTLNLENPSAGFEFNYVPREAQEKIVNVSVSNSFGFGGTNASLVFAKHGYKK